MIVPSYDHVTAVERTVVRFDDGLACQCALAGLWWRNLGYDPVGEDDSGMSGGGNGGWPTTARSPGREEADYRSSVRRLVIDLVDLGHATRVLLVSGRQQAVHMAVRLAEYNRMGTVVVARDPLSTESGPSVTSIERPDVGEAWEAPPAIISDETYSGFRHQGRWFAPDIDGREVDAVVIGPGLTNGSFGTHALVIGPRLETIPDDLGHYWPDNGECEALLTVGSRFMSSQLRLDSDRNARLLTRGIETLVSQKSLQVPAEWSRGRTSDWDHVLRLPPDRSSTRHPEARLQAILERLRQERVWVAGLRPDRLLIMPAITSTEADVARILDGLHAVL